MKSAMQTPTGIDLMLPVLSPQWSGQVRAVGGLYHRRVSFVVLLGRLACRCLEGEQHVAAAAIAEARVARADEHHAARHCDAGRAHRTALRGNAVDGREIADR